MNKLCRTCGDLKSLKSFSVAPTNKDGLRGTCKICNNLKHSEYRLKKKEEDPEGYKAKRRATKLAYKNKQMAIDPIKYKNKAANSKLKYKYGITLNDYNTMLKSQAASCAICGTKDPGRGEKLYVDHCHRSKKVRGLLCLTCNIGLGHFKDNTSLLITAANYLDNHRIQEYD
jgi:hypothetical protein|tara:strand:+ start:62 stop:577 length:516 start_codon:yes stop_codon:yes gene_type:complete